MYKATRVWRLFCVSVVLLTAQNLWADGYSDALAILQEMDSASTTNLELVLNLQEQGRLLDAVGGCAGVARQMKTQEDRVWQIYTEECTLAVQSLYLASTEQTRFWLAEMNAFTMMARGMYDMAQLQLDQAELCEKAFAASLQHASLCYEMGL